MFYDVPECKESFSWWAVMSAASFAGRGAKNLGGEARRQHGGEARRRCASRPTRLGDSGGVVRCWPLSVGNALDMKALLTVVGRRCFKLECEH